jgi:RNA polymerase sigma-70 factor, ECF subfamily
MKVSEALIPVAIPFRDRRVEGPDAIAAAREARFTALVERQARFVFQIAYALLRDAADSEDVVQETFLKLFRGNAWERMENERAFLARTAWRIAVGRNRPQYAQMEADIFSPDMDPEQSAIAANRSASIHRMIDSLPEELRQALVLSAVEEMTSREAGEVLGIAEGTVRTRLMRARQMLKQKMLAMRGEDR